MNWASQLSSMESLGVKSKRESNARSSESRSWVKGQFFTPGTAARFMWDLVLPTLDEITSAGRKASIYDNSVGTGRLLQFADPASHQIFGTDVHGDSIEALTTAAEAAGFEFDFLKCGMEAVRRNKFDVALINPPFSITLDSPYMYKFRCTSHGTFGPNKRAKSELFAVEQALSMCGIVVALVPQPARFFFEDPENGYSDRLRAVISLPGDTFKDEGASVSTVLLVFDADRQAGRPHEMTVREWPAAAEDLALLADPEKAWQGIPLRKRGQNDGPAVTAPVTGDQRVWLGHNGRKINLKFACGLTEARVKNRVLRDPVIDHTPEEHRYPKGITHQGDGLLDIEVHAIQDNPAASFARLVESIEAGQGIPVIDPGLVNHLQKRSQQLKKERTPFRHTVWREPGMLGKDGERANLTGIARKTHVANPSTMLSPVIKAGEEIKFELVCTNGHSIYQFTAGGQTFEVTTETLEERFDISANPAASEGRWELVHPGRIEAFPEMAAQLRHKMESLGLTKYLSWGFQSYDLVESLITGRGETIAWDMGLGKARLGLCLALMGGKHNLVALEPHLVEEMSIELDTIKLDSDLWQIIDSPAKLASLKKINIITYNKLRSLVDPGQSRRITYAHRLRRRIANLIADEGDRIRNETTQQTRALKQVSAKKRFNLTGTPIANYPRDMIGIANFTSGDATGSQPYGRFRGFLEQRQANSSLFTQRGVDAFREHFIVTEWHSKAFEEDLADGAKREIPRIKDVERFRKYAAPLIKRRVQGEPEVAVDVQIKKPVERTPLYVDWDDGHLAYYLTVATEFSSWYLRERELTAKTGKLPPFAAVLARIGAVEQACSMPSKSRGGFGTYTGMTSKQRFTLEHLEKLTNAGNKTVLYAKSPAVLELFRTKLAERGIEGVLFHGDMSIPRRNRMLNERFRWGPAPVLLASLGVTETGLNLWQANRALYYSRAWTYKAEHQSLHRLLRPQQERQVIKEAVHLPGSIDDYMAQVVAFKRESFHTGLDWATPKHDGVQFQHLDSILYAFCKRVMEARGFDRIDQIKQALAA